MNVNIGARGAYKISIKRHGKVIKETPEFDNLLLDNAFRTDYNPSHNSVFMVLGSGTTPPQVTDTSLENQVASKGVINSNTSRGEIVSFVDGIATYRKEHTTTFTKGSVVGNISEVGIGNSGILTSRALIQDENGNPVTLTLTEIDELTVTYYIYLVWDLNQRTQVMNINGVDTTVTISHHAYGDMGALFSDNKYFGLTCFAQMLYRWSTYALQSKITAWDIGDTSELTFPSVSSGLNTSNYFSVLGYNEVYFAGVSSENINNSAIKTTVTLISNASSSVRNGNVGLITSYPQQYYINPCFALMFDPPIPRVKEQKFTITLSFTISRM